MGGVGRGWGIGGRQLVSAGLLKRSIARGAGVKVVAPMNSHKAAALPSATPELRKQEASVKGLKLESRGARTPRALSIVTFCPLFFLLQT